MFHGYNEAGDIEAALCRWPGVLGEPDGPVLLHLPAQLFLVRQQQCRRPPVQQQHLPAWPRGLGGRRGWPLPVVPALPVPLRPLPPIISGQPELGEPSTTGLYYASFKHHTQCSLHYTQLRLINCLSCCKATSGVLCMEKTRCCTFCLHSSAVSAHKHEA